MKSKKSATSQREVRTITAAQPMTVRTTSDGSKQIGGYAIVWNSLSTDLGGFKEICSPKMLDRTLRENPDVLALRDHRTDLLIGRTTAKTLQLETDSTGLAFTITLPATSIGDDTAENVRVRNLTGCSFGFATREDSWAVDDNGNVVRTLLDVDLYEISITSFPAYAATTATTLRSCPADIRCRIRHEDEDEEVNDYRPECDEESDEYDPDACEDDDDDYEEEDSKRSDSLRIRTLFAHRMNA